MVNEELKEELKKNIKEYGLNSEQAYSTSLKIACELDKVYKERSSVESHYASSIDALSQYINENEKNPTEKIWNQFAREHGFLSSLSLGYISGFGFNILCKKMRKWQIAKKL